MATIAETGLWIVFGLGATFFIVILVLSGIQSNHQSHADIQCRKLGYLNAVRDCETMQCKQFICTEYIKNNARVIVG